MGTKEILKGSAVYLISFLAVLLVLSPPRPEAAEPGKFSQAVEVKDNLVAVNARDVELSSLLKAIEKKTGVKINIGKGLVGKKVTIRFQNLDVENALRTILGTNYLFVLTKDQTEDKYTLKEVSVVGYLSPKLSSAKMTTIELAYGSGKEDVGVVYHPAVGPKSFAVDHKDNVYILDTVNERVQILSPGGKHLSSFRIQPWAVDIAVDRYGFVYVYAGESRLYQYSPQGVKLGQIRIDESRWIGWRAMHICNDKIYHDTCNRDNTVCGDFLMATISNGSLVPPTYEELETPVQSGTYAASGRRYSLVKLTQFEKAEIQITEKDGVLSRLLSIALQGIGSIGVLGEDASGNFYIETVRLYNGNERGEIEEIHEFNREGTYLNTTPMPEVRPAYWAAKTYLVSQSGTIYQLSAETEKLKLNIFHTKPK